MQWRSRSLAVLSLALHGAAVVLLPLLHEGVHRRGHAGDHLHLGTQTVWLPSALEGLPGEGAASEGEAFDEAHSPDALHAAFDEDLVALGLLEAGHAGVAVVDCSLARYTLVECGSRDAPAHGFGDELAARTHHHAPRSGAPSDPEHGLHSLEHGGLAIPGTPTFLLSPPARRLELVDRPAPPSSPGTALRSALRARAPPRPV